MSDQKKNWFVRHKVLTVILGLVVLFIVIGAAGGGKKTPTSTSQPASNQQKAAESEKSKFDIAAFYEQVQNGQTKAQVVQLAGKDPSNCSESQFEGLGTTEICTWTGSLGDSNVATITFNNGTVNSKTKTGF